MKSIAIVLSAIGLFLLAVSYSQMTAVSALVLGVTLVFFAQGILSALGMLYTWSDHTKGYTSRPPKGEKNEKVTFSLLVPARHEEKVIGDTVKAMTRIDYPKELYEVLVLVRADDTGTIGAVKKAIQEIGDEEKVKNVNLVVFDGGPINKPRALNVGLELAQNAFVGVFDAEDEPHPEILSRVEAHIRRKKVDAVQGGVQLVNVGSRWFTALNCLEYYYWFKSVLPFYASLGAVPLGGNTVFMRTRAMHALGGWDEESLTEDADIGIRLSAAGYKIGMMYDARLSTLEEAPVTVDGFIKQRARWDQGYIQVLLKGDWAGISDWKSQLLTFYLLFQSLFRSVWAVGLVLVPVSLVLKEVPMWLAILSFLPLQFLLIQWGMYVIGLRELRKEYGLKFSRMWAVWVIVLYYPYQFLLTWAAVRALGRFVVGSWSWDKTAHVNAHRIALG